MRSIFKHKQYFIKQTLICLFIFIVKIGAAQIAITTPANSFTSASQGDLYVDTNNIVYIGLQDGSLKALGTVGAIGNNNDDFLVWNTVQEKWEAQSSNFTVTKTTISQLKRARVNLQQNNLVI